MELDGVGLWVDLSPSTIDGLVYVVGDVHGEDVALRFAFAEAHGRNVLSELSVEDLEFLRREVRDAAVKWLGAIQFAVRAGWRRDSLPFVGGEL